MKVALVFPPQWTAAQPFFGVSSVNGQLRRAGHDVRIFDLNLEFMESALTVRTARLSRARLKSELDFRAASVRLRTATGDRTSKELDRDAEKLAAIEAYLTSTRERGPTLDERLPSALGVLRDPTAFYTPRSLVEAMLVMDEALALYSAPYFPSTVSWNSFSHPHVSMNIGPLIELAKDRLSNPFRAFYEPWLGRLLDWQPDLVAISVTAFTQLAPGLTLASMLRAAAADRASKSEGATWRPPHIDIGGNFFTRLRSSLLGMPRFFEELADSVIIGEREGPIVALAEALDPTARGTLAEVPNLVYFDRDAGAPRWTFERPPPPMDAVAIQDLTGFPLERYLAPDRVVCVRASKGCYYGQCTFCDSHYGLSSDVMSIERLIAELTQLRDAHGVRNFEFIDQCIDPDYLEKMCDAMIAADLGVRWFFNARTEPGFTRPLLEKARRAGATMIMWGVESASPRLLKLMHKGVSGEGRMAILADSAAAGLWNFAYVFFGFPSETEEEAQATIDLIRGHTDLIHSYGRSIFTLGKHSPLFEAADHYGILRFVEDKEDLSTNLTFETASGISGERVAHFGQLCMDLCREAYRDPLWMALRSRENLHLYLAHHGPEVVRQYNLRDNELSDGRPEFSF